MHLRDLTRPLIGFAVAVAALCWPTDLTMPIKPIPPTLTYWNLAGIWHTTAMDYGLTLYVQPRESAAFAIRSVIFSWGDRTEVELRVRAIGLGRGPGALLQLDEPGGPFRRAGYFAVHLGRSGYRAANGRIVGVRDSLRICPIPSTLLIEAIRSGRLDGTI